MFLFSPLFIIIFFLSHSIYFYFFETESHLKKINQSNTTYIFVSQYPLILPIMKRCTRNEVYMSVLFLSPTVIMLNAVYFSICQYMYII